MKAIRNYSFTVSVVPANEKVYLSITAKHKMVKSVTRDLIKEIKVKKHISKEKFASAIAAQTIELIDAMNEKGVL